MPYGYHVADGSASTDLFGYQFPANNTVGFRLDFVGRERQGTTPKPGVVLGAGAGTGPTGLTVTGTDNHGNITFTSGTTPTAASTVATITFANTFTGTNPPICQIEPKDAGGANALYYVTNVGSAGAWTGAVIKTAAGTTALPASTAVSLDYVFIGGA